MGTCFDLLVDVGDLAILIDIESDSLEGGPVRVGCLSTRITQNGIVELQRLGILLIRFGLVATGSKEGDVELVEARAFTGFNFKLASAE